MWVLAGVETIHDSTTNLKRLPPSQMLLSISIIIKHEHFTIPSRFHERNLIGPWNLGRVSEDRYLHLRDTVSRSVLREVLSSECGHISAFSAFLAGRLA